MNGGGWDISGDQLDLACEAIAQVAEEENTDLRYQLARAEARGAELQGRLDGIAYHWQGIKNAAIESQSNCAMIIGRIEQIAYLACGPQITEEAANAQG